MTYLRPTGDPAADVAALDAWLAATDPAPLVVTTSGSTGTPKQVVLSREAVLASVAASAARLGGSGRWSLMLPSSYVAGVQVICRSLVADHAPVLGGLGDADYVSLVPTQLHRHLDSVSETAALRGIRTILIGGGPVDPRLRARAASAGLKLVATYGSAETAGGCVYDGLPLDGVAVALAVDGRIRIAGPTLFDGYLDDDAQACEVLVDGWFHTSDAGRLDDDGRLHVLGRVDDVAVTGGVNVPLGVVAARLRAHPDVSAAEVVGVPDEEWGQRIVAFVVGPVSLEAARDWVAAEHPRAWAPRSLVALDALPMLPNGKADRLALQELT
ncbi:MAG: AMP-binding protein [Nocardioides sp.]